MIEFTPARFEFKSYVDVRNKVRDFDQMTVKNEPMLFSCDFDNACELGGPITKEFLANLTEEFYWSKDLIIDSRVHMLMPGWYPCIPGFHHDDVPRERADGQPNYHEPSYKAQHAMMLINGDICPTEFAIGAELFDEVPLGEICYKIWHPQVVNMIEENRLHSWHAPSNRIVYFDWNTWHQGTRAIQGGWRFFIRASINTGRKPTNELRRQVQVYLDKPMEGW